MTVQEQSTGKDARGSVHIRRSSQKNHGWTELRRFFGEADTCQQIRVPQIIGPRQAALSGLRFTLLMCDPTLQVALCEWVIFIARPFQS